MPTSQCTLCELFLNHEERLKRVESQLVSLQHTTNQLFLISNQLQNQVNGILQSLNLLRNSLSAHLNTTVIIQTDVGSVTGMLTAVGDDFVEIAESSGDTVFVLLANVVSF